MMFDKIYVVTMNHSLNKTTTFRKILEGRYILGDESGIQSNNLYKLKV